jgi:hypothetical protein
MALPASTLRSNVNTWSVPTWAIPAVACQMLDALPPEAFDPNFQGQGNQTTYFDTAGERLRRARVPKKEYVTLRLRSYGASTAAGGLGPKPAFALSAKTQDAKARIDVSPAVAAALLAGPDNDLLAQLLPPALFSRLLTLTAGEPLGPVVTVQGTRYAVEDDNLRLTLDTSITTDTGKALPFHVLEFKAARGQPAAPGRLPTPGLRPLKLSKFLWSTDWR